MGPPHVKDIVAEAMREVEESNQKKQQAAAVAAAQQRQQQEQQILAQRQVTVATIPQVNHATAIAIKSEPHVTVDPQQQHIIHQQPQHIQQQIIQEEPRDVKPNIAAVNAATALSKGEPAKPITATTPKPSTSGATPTSQTRTYNRSQPRTQIMPRLQLLDDEDDGLTCRLCLQAFWYRDHLNEHLKEAHSIADPTKYEAEEALDQECLEDLCPQDHVHPFNIETVPLFVTCVRKVSAMEMIWLLIGNPM